ncbi:tectonic-like complex member MKS1 [Cylas formicarius]|uniref:tectonic-like complex member MKS1 n=1 Tax=Cylas formicarius TaxID=197179 RepID=UPI0029585FAD|nr:tectonic-like complex member MKS1 [Cylas formicarius]
MDRCPDYLMKHPHKYAGIYRSPDKIKNFKIKLTLWKITDKPKKSAEKLEEKVFSWQEKCFSRHHHQFYRDERNCVTDLDKRYFKILNEMNESNDNSLFSYVNEDRYDIPNDRTIKTNNYLKNILDGSGKFNDSLREEEYDFHSHLLESMQYPVIISDLERMFLMVDLGESLGNTWIPNEVLLCAIKYNKRTKCLTVDPDFTTTMPYRSEIPAPEDIKYCFFVENYSQDIPEAVELKEDAMVKKISSLKMSLQYADLGRFELPPKNKLLVYLFFDINSGLGFEYPDLFVEYFIDLRGEWKCQNTKDLRGRTQICRSKGKGSTVHFGHCIELVLHCNIQELERAETLNSPYIYFEVISRDSWERHRTEGLCYRGIPLGTAGAFTFTLHCIRFLPDNILGRLRRSFIGDYKNYNDLTWIGIPQQFQGKVLNKFGTNTLTTGELNVRLSVLHQSQAFLEGLGDDSGLIFNKLKSSGLIKSVDEVLQAFKRARRQMMEARKNL